MAGIYTIQNHSDTYPQKQSDTKTSFYVRFTASNGEMSNIQYYEVDSVDTSEIKEIMQKVADDYDAMILSSGAVGQINGL